MVHKRVRCATGCSGVDWLPMAILGGRAVGSASVSTLGGRAGVFTGDGGGTGVGIGPGGGVLGVFTELVILHELARLFIKYCKRHGTVAGCACPGAVSNGRIRRLWGWRRHGEDGA